MMSSPDIANLAAALVKAQAALPNVPKETMGQVGNQRRAYADLATVTDTVRPVLAAHGLAYVQGCSDGSGGFVTVTTRLMHTSGEWLEDSLSMPTGNGSAQSVGSAITYARRYSLMAALGLAPDDDDGEAASSSPPRQRRPRREPPPDTDRPLPPDDPSGTAARPSRALTARCMAMFGERGLGDRADRLAFTSRTIGRDVQSWTEVSAVEASRVASALEAEPVDKEGDDAE